MKSTLSCQVDGLPADHHKQHERWRAPKLIPMSQFSHQKQKGPTRSQRLLKELWRETQHQNRCRAVLPGYLFLLLYNDVYLCTICTEWRGWWMEKLWGGRRNWWLMKFLLTTVEPLPLAHTVICMYSTYLCRCCIKQFLISSSEEVLHDHSHNFTFVRENLRKTKTAVKRSPHKIRVHCTMFCCMYHSEQCHQWRHSTAMQWTRVRVW